MIEVVRMLIGIEGVSAKLEYAFAGVLAVMYIGFVLALILMVVYRVGRR